MRERLRALGRLVPVVLLVAAAGCGTSSAGGDGGDETCADPDKAVVQQIMAGARTDFRPVLAGGERGVRIDHLKLRDASVGTLPEADRKFGAERLVVLLVSTVFGGEDASDDLSGAQGPVYFALDGDGKLLGPVGTFTASQFDLDAPKDPGWLSWGDKVEKSDFGGTLYACVNPS